MNLMKKQLFYNSKKTQHNKNQMDIKNKINKNKLKCKYKYIKIQERITELEKEKHLF